ncbi:MAG: alkaline shock response membrane anchor protein AmaP [Eubacteriales bacterium]|nr:alkaline shock response membrane anchor protein AmaP [Eubacteriales bacterium]
MRKILRSIGVVLLVFVLLVCTLLFFITIIPALRGMLSQYIGNLELYGVQDRAYALFILILLSAFALYALVRSANASAKLRHTAVGGILVSTAALESIALNSAKASQSGVKTAKVKIRNRQNKQILVSLSVNVYSDVEIPVMMARVQERVKKDLEHYTGLAIEAVEVKVARVEEIAARVER